MFCSSNVVLELLGCLENDDLENEDLRPRKRKVKIWEIFTFRRRCSIDLLINVSLQCTPRDTYISCSCVIFITRFIKPSLAFLRWLDTVFQGQYLPSLSINYVAKNCMSKALRFLQITAEHQDCPFFTVFPTTKSLSQNISITLLQISLNLHEHRGCYWRKKLP